MNTLNIDGIIIGSELSNFGKKMIKGENINQSKKQIIKDTYYLIDLLNSNGCFLEAKDLKTYLWQNLKTNEFYIGEKEYPIIDEMNMEHKKNIASYM